MIFNFLDLHLFKWEKWMTYEQVNNFQVNDHERGTKVKLRKPWKDLIVLSRREDTPRLKIFCQRSVSITLYSGAFECGWLIPDLIKVIYYNVTVYKVSFNYYPSHIPLKRLWLTPSNVWQKSIKAVKSFPRGCRIFSCIMEERTKMLSVQFLCFRKPD